MTTRDEAIQKAIDTLSELCDPAPLPGSEDDKYEARERIDTRRRSAEQILDHYREQGEELRSLAIERAHKRAEPYEGASGRLILLCPAWELPFDDEMEIA